MRNNTLNQLNVKYSKLRIANTFAEVFSDAHTHVPDALIPALAFQETPRSGRLWGRNAFVGLFGHFLCIVIRQPHVQPGHIHLTATKFLFSPNESAVKFLRVLRYGKSGRRT